jgi:hypothetical protein
MRNAFKNEMNFISRRAFHVLQNDEMVFLCQGRKKEQKCCWQWLTVWGRQLPLSLVIVVIVFCVPVSPVFPA